MGNAARSILVAAVILGAAGFLIAWFGRDNRSGRESVESVRDDASGGGRPTGKRPKRTVAARVTVAEGGKLALPKGLSVEVPPGAVEDDVELSLTAADSSGPSRPGRQEYRIQPDLQLKKPATLLFPWTAATGDLAAGEGRPPRVVVSCRRTGGHWKVVPSTLDAAAGVVRVETDHFSGWKQETLPDGDFGVEGPENKQRRYFKTAHFKIYFEEIAHVLVSTDDEFKPVFAQRIAAEFEYARAVYQKWGFRVHDADGSLGRSKHQEVRLVVQLPKVELGGAALVPFEDAPGRTYSPWVPALGGVICIVATAANDIELDAGERLGVTCWHEYFHRCQHQYVGLPNNSGEFLNEATAATMQVLLDPDGAEEMLKYDENLTPVPLATTSLTDQQYSAMPFFLYLVEKHGSQGHGYEVIRSMWEKFPAPISGTTALARTIKEYEENAGGDASSADAQLRLAFHDFAEAFYVLPRGELGKRLFPLMHQKWRNGSQKPDSSIIAEAVLPAAKSHTVVFADKPYLTAEYRLFDRQPPGKIRVRVDEVASGTSVRIYEVAGKSGQLRRHISDRESGQTVDIGRVGGGNRIGVLVTHTGPNNPGGAKLTFLMDEEPPPARVNPAGPQDAQIYEETWELAEVKIQRRTDSWTKLVEPQQETARSVKPVQMTVEMLDKDGKGCVLRAALTMNAPQRFVLRNYRLEKAFTFRTTALATWNLKIDKPLPSGRLMLMAGGTPKCIGDPGPIGPGQQIEVVARGPIAPGAHSLTDTTTVVYDEIPEDRNVRPDLPGRRVLVASMTATLNHNTSADLTITCLYKRAPKASPPSH